MVAGKCFGGWAGEEGGQGRRVGRVGCSACRAREPQRWHVEEELATQPTPCRIDPPKGQAKTGKTSSRFIYIHEVLVNLIYVRTLGRNIKSIKETKDLQSIVCMDIGIREEHLLPGLLFQVSQVIFKTLTIPATLPPHTLL